MKLPFLALLVPAVALAQVPSTPAEAQLSARASACPTTGYGPFPCAAFAVVALVDQAEALGLSADQADGLRALRDQHLNDIHDTLGDLGALREALHALPHPHVAGEVFALLYDIGRHEAELDALFREAEAALLSRLDEPQRARWDALVAAAGALQEKPGTRIDR